MKFKIIFLFLLFFSLTACSNKQNVTIATDFSTNLDVYSETPDWSKAIVIKSGEVKSIDDSEVKLDLLGTYHVYFTFDDDSEYSLEVHVVDRVAPTITGVNDKTLEVKSALPDFLEGITVSDNYDQNLAVSDISVNYSALNINRIGTYSVIYTLNDRSENPCTLTMQITVVDTENPEIHGLSDMTIQANETVSWLKNIYVLDNYNQLNLTLQNVDLSQLRMDSLGTYPVTYSISDSSGNMISNTIQVTVIDTLAPTIQVSGDLGTKVNQSFDVSPHLEVMDNLDGEITNYLIDMSEVNYTQTGLYNVYITATDSHQNSVTKTVTLEVYTPMTTFESVDIRDAQTMTGNTLNGSTDVDNNFVLYKIYYEDPQFVMITNVTDSPVWLYLYYEKYPDYFVPLDRIWEGGTQLQAGIESRYLYYVFYSNYAEDFSVSIFSFSVDPENTFKIADEKLDYALKDDLNIVDFNITHEVAENVTHLDLTKYDIEKLDGIENFIHVCEVHADNNQISDLSPLIEIIENNDYPDGNYSVRGNPLSQDSITMISNALETYTITFEFDLTPDFEHANTLSLSDLASGAIDQWNIDTYKLENTNHKIISISLESETLSVSSTDVSFDLYTIQDGNYVLIHPYDQYSGVDKRFAVIVSVYDEVFIAVKAKSNQSYSLTIKSVDRIDNSHLIYFQDPNTYSRVYANFFGEEIPWAFTEQMMSMDPQIFMWHQSLQYIPYFTNIEYLGINGCDFDNLKFLDNLKLLKELAINNNELTDISYLKTLYDSGNFSHLKKLDLSGNQLSESNEIVQYLKSQGIEVIV